MIDGFYALFFTGRQGSGFAVLVLRDGVVAGADAVGGIYDGEYTANPENGRVEGEMNLTSPPGMSLVTGQQGGAEPTTHHFPFSLPPDLNEQQVAQVQLPSGPVNVRFRKIRDLPKA